MTFRCRFVDLIFKLWSWACALARSFVSLFVSRANQSAEPNAFFYWIQQLIFKLHDFFFLVSFSSSVYSINNRKKKCIDNTNFLCSLPLVSLVFLAPVAVIAAVVLYLYILFVSFNLRLLLFNRSIGNLTFKPYDLKVIELFSLILVLYIYAYYV